MKKTLSGIIAVIIIVTLLAPSLGIFSYAAPSPWDGTASDSFKGGSGTEKSPYYISDANELAYFAKLINDGNKDYSDKYFRLMNNINLNSVAWSPVGTLDNPFSGTFDGDKYSISWMSAAATDGEYRVSGLFGVLENALVKNVKLSGTVSVIAGDTAEVSAAAGGIAGYARLSTIENCIVNVNALSSCGGSASSGALVGETEKCEIYNCYSSGYVHALGGQKSYSGGVFGAAVKRSGDYASPELTIKSENANNDGVVSDTSVINSVSSATVSTIGSINENYAGGIIGSGGSCTFVTNCLFYGSVICAGDRSVDNAAGIAASVGNGAATYCYWLSNSSINPNLLTVKNGSSSNCSSFTSADSSVIYEGNGSDKRKLADALNAWLENNNPDKKYTKWQVKSYFPEPTGGPKLNSLFAEINSATLFFGIAVVLIGFVAVISCFVILRYSKKKTLAGAAAHSEGNDDVSAKADAGAADAVKTEDGKMN